MIPSDDRDKIAFELDNDDQIRIDVLLAKKFPEQSRSYFQKLIDKGLVLLNGKEPKKQTRPEKGDLIEVVFELNQEIRLDPEDIPIDIVYEDDHFVCVNKAPGMVVHPAPGNWRGTLANALLHHFNKLPGKDALRPGIVHRLDKDTSGLLLVARSLECHRKLIEMFSQRQIKKEYISITWGTPHPLESSAPIGRHPKNRKKQAITEGGRDSYTRFEVLKSGNGFCLVKAYPTTGRTHQIRVHLQALGAPILADALYGSKTAKLKHPSARLQLHAQKLSFEHPMTGKKMELEAEIPDDMTRLMDHLF